MLKDSPAASPGRESRGWRCRCDISGISVLSGSAFRQRAHPFTQMFEKQAQTHDAIIRLVDSVMEVSSCVVEVQRFKTSDHLSDGLHGLQLLVNEVSTLVHTLESRSEKPSALGLLIKAHRF